MRFFRFICRWRGKHHYKIRFLMTHRITDYYEVVRRCCVCGDWMLEPDADIMRVRDYMHCPHSHPSRNGRLILKGGAPPNHQPQPQKLP